MFFKLSYKALLSTEVLSANKDTQDTGKDEASVSSKIVTSGQNTSEGMITFY